MFFSKFSSVERGFIKIFSNFRYEKELNNVNFKLKKTLKIIKYTSGIVQKNFITELNWYDKLHFERRG